MASSRFVPSCLACCGPSPARNMASGYYSMDMNDIRRTHYHKAEGPSWHAAHGTVAVASVSLGCYRIALNLIYCPFESCQETVWAVKTKVGGHSELGDSLQDNWTWLPRQHAGCVVLDEIQTAYGCPAWVPLVHNSVPVSVLHAETHGRKPASYLVQETAAAPSCSPLSYCPQSLGTGPHKRKTSHCLNG